MATARVLTLTDIRRGTGKCPWRIEFQIDEHHVSAFFRPPEHSGVPVDDRQVALVAIPILCDLAVVVRSREVVVADHLRFPRFDRVFKDAVGALLAEQDAFWSRRSFTDIPDLRVHARRSRPHQDRLDPKHAVLGFSGGKDSIMSLFALAEAGYVVHPLLLNEGDRTWQDIRQWIPKLRRMGFHPMTSYLLPGRRRSLENSYGDWHYSSYQIGWLAAILAIAAAGVGAKHIVMGIERSADLTLSSYKGRAVNHQHQKSTRHLALLQDLFRRTLHPGLSIASPISHLSDSDIIDLLLERVPPSFREFSSCGAATWQTKFCGACDKCAFVFAVLSRTSAGRRLAQRLFRRDLLEDVDLYRPWVDARYRPVLACVGPREEVWEAFAQMLDDGFDRPVLRKWRSSKLRRGFARGMDRGVRRRPAPLGKSVADAVSVITGWLGERDGPLSGPTRRAPNANLQSAIAADGNR